MTSDLTYFRYGNYNIVTDCRPTPREQRIRVGLRFLARNNSPAEKIRRMTGSAPLVENRSLKLYSTCSPSAAIRRSGVYIPPPKTKVIGPEIFPQLGAPPMAPECDDAPPQFRGGDFDATS